MMMFIYIERVCVCFLMCKRAREVVESRCDLPLRRRKKGAEIYILREVNYIQTENKREREQRDARGARKKRTTSRFCWFLSFLFFGFLLLVEAPPSGSKKEQPDPQKQKKAHSSNSSFCGFCE